ncbi:3'-5' exoribonuclease YhaM family protein [Spiroplasma cantharicola]|uniref:3'-5' exoribonuclease YhaM n=1 Tax=Spiroplasma cantharicola TaxID=362837 RepID=A0A0M4JXA4_9MOLU|nr:HD domain-containing protein [Spiroplasma cantharicola]ALD66717.1 3'-5' exoribonuclease YhaM [Spiroplasma cantharicola]
MINEINADSKIVTLIARIEKAILSTGNNGANYLILNLVDMTGRIEARLWNSTEKDLDELKTGLIVKIEAVTNVYRQQLQLKVNSYEIINEGDYQKHSINEEMFSISAPINVKTNYVKLVDFINSLENKTYKTITLEILKQYEVEFKTFPAAVSIHHNVVGGLFWHSFSLLMGAKALREVYKYADIDWELVYCGTILHDIGKVLEMAGKNASEYTDQGKLLGHISIGNTFVSNKAIQLGLQDNEDVLKLQHAILASHGKNEYGSPVEPLLIEAVIISSLDSLDARIYKINDELSKVEEGAWTSRILSEDGRSYLNHIKKRNKSKSSKIKT